MAAGQKVAAPVPDITAGAKRTAASGVKPSSAGGKVTVASKLPMSLLLQICSSRTETRRDRATIWQEEVFFKTGPVVVIRGTAYPNGEVPEGMPERPRMVAGYALTPGVDEDWWNTWVEQNAEFPAVKAGLVFAFPKMDAIIGCAKEHRDLDSNLGPLRPARDGNQETDPRMPRKLSLRERLAADAVAAKAGEEALAAE